MVKKKPAQPVVVAGVVEHPVADTYVAQVRTRLVGVLDAAGQPVGKDEYLAVCREIQDMARGVARGCQTAAAYLTTLRDAKMRVAQALPFPGGRVLTAAEVASAFGGIFQPVDPTKHDILSEETLAARCVGAAYTPLGRKVSGGPASMAGRLVRTAMTTAAKKGGVQRASAWTTPLLPLRGDHGNSSGEVKRVRAVQLALFAGKPVRPYFALLVTLRAARTVECRVLPQDTLGTFAARHGFAASEIVATNSVHRVTPGETGLKIAQRYGVSITALTRLNRGATFVPGSRVTIPFVFAADDLLPQAMLRVPQPKPTQVWLLLSAGKDGSGASRLKQVAQFQTGERQTDQAPRLGDAKFVHRTRGRRSGLEVHLTCVLPAARQRQVADRTMAVALGYSYGLRYAYRATAGGRPFFGTICSVDKLVKLHQQEEALQRRLARESRNRKWRVGGRGYRRRNKAALARGTHIRDGKTRVLRQQVADLFRLVQRHRVGVLYLPQTAGWASMAQTSGMHNLAAHYSLASYAQQIKYKASQLGVQIREVGEPAAWAADSAGKKHKTINIAQYLDLCCPDCHRVDPNSKIDERHFGCTYCQVKYPAADVALRNMLTKGIAKLILADPYIQKLQTGQVLGARARRKQRKAPREAAAVSAL